MEKNLTVKLDKFILDEAKEYALANKKSLSQIIESYLITLISKTKKTNKIAISPYVKSLSKGKCLPLEIDYKEEKTNHIKTKYA